MQTTADQSLYSCKYIPALMWREGDCDCGDLTCVTVRR